MLKAILSFRDQINGDQSFVTFKTLVGFEAVFAPAWDEEHFDVARETTYRREKIEALVGDISSAANFQDWLATTGRCAQTKSNDGATFLAFRLFLKEFAKRKPELAIRLVEEPYPDLIAFLPSVLRGLDSGPFDASMRSILRGWDR